jgi:hypothetical protein
VTGNFSWLSILNVVRTLLRPPFANGYEVAQQGYGRQVGALRHPEALSEGWLRPSEAQKAKWGTTLSGTKHF